MASNLLPEGFGKTMEALAKELESKGETVIPAGALGPQEPTSPIKVFMGKLKKKKKGAMPLPLDPPVSANVSDALGKAMDEWVAKKEPVFEGTAFTAHILDEVAAPPSPDIILPGTGAGKAYSAAKLAKLLGMKGDSEIQAFKAMMAEKQQNQQNYALAEAKANAQKVIQKLGETHQDIFKKIDLKVLASILPLKLAGHVQEHLIQAGVPEGEQPMYLDTWIMMNQGPGAGLLSTMVKGALPIGLAPSGPGAGVVGFGAVGGLAGGGKSFTQAYQAAMEKEKAEAKWQQQQKAYQALMALGEPNLPTLLLSSEQVKQQYEAMLAAPALPPALPPALMFKGCPVKLDPTVSPGVMYLLNPVGGESYTIGGPFSSGDGKTAMVEQMREAVNKGFTDIHASPEAYTAYEEFLKDNAMVMYHQGPPAPFKSPLEFENKLFFGSAKKSGKDNWGTPQNVVDWIAATLGLTFDLDAFADDTNAKAPLYFTPVQDGYASTWFGNVWINPEYSNVAKALVKAAAEFHSGNVDAVVALVAARTDTQWWWDAMQSCTQVIFIKGRIKFLDPDGVVQDPAPFPSAFIIWRKVPKTTPFQVAWVDMKKNETIIGYQGSYEPKGEPVVDSAPTPTEPEAPGMSPAPAPHTGDYPGGDPP